MIKKYLIAACFVTLFVTPATYAQSRADFTLTFSRLGATQQEADSRLTAALGAFAVSLPGSADIYQRDGNGEVITANGKPLFDRKKVEARIVDYFDAQVDSADIASRAESRKVAAIAQIDQEEKDVVAGQKPPREDKAVEPENLRESQPTIRTRPQTRPVRRRRNQ